MSPFLRMKKKQKLKEWTTKENIVPFSYTLAYPLLRHQNHFCVSWKIIEKGSKKAKLSQRYKFSSIAIRTAKIKIGRYILGTPHFESMLFCHQGFNIYFKGEVHQITGSIKARGVVYSLLQLTSEQKHKGVIAISTGSFAYSLCYFGKKLKIPVTVVMPDSTANEKVKECRNLAATVLVQGKDMEEAHNIALRIAERDGLCYLDGNDHPNMIIGQATLGLEIIENIEKINIVLLPTTINGCGLTTGIAMAIKEWNPNIKIVEVRTTVSDPLVENIRRHTISSDELEIPITEYTWYESQYGLPEMWFDTIVTVNETLVRIAADLLLTEANIVDSNAAIGVAAILAGELHKVEGNSVLILLYGKIDLITELTKKEQ